jgi:hypothetical protein
MITEKESTLNEIKPIFIKELEEYITQAMQKVNATTEGELCRYIPDNSGTAIHHFTFFKLKRSNPQALMATIKRHILDKKPEKALSKPRTRKASSNYKRAIEIKFTRDQLSRLLVILKKTDDNDLLNLVSSYQPAREIQKRMLEMIKQKQMDPELLEAYVQLIKKENA